MLYVHGQSEPRDLPIKPEVKSLILQKEVAAMYSARHQKQVQKQFSRNCVAMENLAAHRQAQAEFAPGIWRVAFLGMEGE